MKGKQVHGLHIEGRGFVVVRYSTSSRQVLNDQNDNIIRSCQSKKQKQCNGRTKKNSNDLQKIHRKLKIEQHEAY